MLIRLILNYSCAKMLKKQTRKKLDTNYTLGNECMLYTNEKGCCRKLKLIKVLKPRTSCRLRGFAGGRGIYF